MKKTIKKKTIDVIVAIMVVINILSLSVVQCFAHNAMLDVNTDNCSDNIFFDGLDETWYMTTTGFNCYHISHTETTIKYYFSETSMDKTYGWTNSESSPISSGEADEIKQAYANSMEKWNNVYFYSYDNNNVVTKHKVVHVVEGTKDDHNLIIYPASSNELEEYHATTQATGTSTTIENSSYVHSHYSNWIMKVNVSVFSSLNPNSSYLDIIREKTGAHELGHILGLCDVDNECTESDEVDHHHEILMGYGDIMEIRSQNITYKDIAGVAVTRGFHTDNDHKWLYSGQVDFGFYKLICTICNGVQYVDNLVGISYEIYNSCGGNHLLTNGNMIAVASYGNSDYYKCKYCRYVAPFSFNVTQNYVKTYYSPSVHKQSNAVEGLEYTVSYEEHTLENHTCIECGSHVEMYDNIYTNISDTQHEVSCSCGEIISIRDHSANRYSYVNSLEHGVYCVCGLLLSYEPHRKVSSGLKTYCRDCGHIFSGSGFTPGIMSGNDGFVNE